MTAVETKTVSIAGRDIEVKRPSDTQISVLMRELRGLSRINKQKDPITSDQVDPIASSVARILSMFESLVVDPDDREFLVDEMAEGRLELDDFMGVLKAFRPDEEKATAVKVSRGGRPRKRV